MNLSTFLDTPAIKSKFETYGLYVVSVNIPEYEGFYKVGMSDVGGLTSRMSDFQTMFFPIRDKVIIHLLINKPQGRRVSQATNKNMITATRYAEQSLHKALIKARWKNEGTGEWFKQPRGQTIDNIIQMAFLHHYGDKEQNIKADGGHCKFCIMEPNDSRKVPKPLVEEGEEPDHVVLEDIKQGSRNIKPTRDINGDLNKDYRKVGVREIIPDDDP